MTTEGEEKRKARPESRKVFTARAFLRWKRIQRRRGIKKGKRRVEIAERKTLGVKSCYVEMALCPRKEKGGKKNGRGGDARQRNRSFKYASLSEEGRNTKEGKYSKLYHH